MSTRVAEDVAAATRRPARWSWPLPTDPAARVPDSGAAEPADRGNWWRRNWFAVCALSLLMASDYKLRVRSATATLGGGADAFILLEIAIYGLVAAHLVLSQRGFPRLRRLPLALYLAVAYVVLLVLSLSYTPYVALAGVRAAQTVVVLSLVLAVVHRGSRSHVHRFAHGFVVLVAASVLFGLLFPMPPVTSLQAGRFTWLMIHPVTAGVYVGLATVVAAVYLLARTQERPGPIWPAWAYAPLLLLVAGGLLGTQTRGAVLGAVVGVLVALTALFRGRRLVASWLVVVVAGAGVVVLAIGTITAYFVRGESTERLASLNARTTLWALARDAVLEEPLFGYGLGATRGLFLEETGLGGGHNAVVNVAVDLGLVGLVVWTALLLVVTVNALRSASATAPGVSVDRALVLGALAFLTVDGIFFEGLGAVSNVAAIWLFVLVGWVVLLRHETRPTHAPGEAAPPVLTLRTWSPAPR